MRLFALLVTILIASSTPSLAHENQLSALLYMEPQTPLANEAFTITFELYDPEGKFIPDAILTFAIPDLDFAKSFSETSQTGIYQMTLSLPEGNWSSHITEATFEGESNTVQFGLKVGEQNREIIEILFPVLKEGPNRQTWIMLFISMITLSISIALSYIYNINSYSFQKNSNYTS